MRKTILMVLFLSLLVFPISASSDNMVGKRIETEVPVKLNGEYLSVNAIGLEGTTYIPVRSAFESLGAEVKWDAEAGEVVIELPETEKDIIEEPQVVEDGDNVEDIRDNETDDKNISEENGHRSGDDDKTELINRISDLNARLKATKNANYFTQKVIDRDRALLSNDDLSPSKRIEIEERISSNQEIIDKNNAIIAELEEEITRLEAELQK